jgi:hypothetical protein
MRQALWVFVGLLSVAVLATTPSARSQTEKQPDKALKDKEPAQSKLWREFEPGSLLKTSHAHFEDVRGHGARSGLSFGESKDTYKLFDAEGKISGDRPKQLLAELKTDLHKAAKASGVQKVGEPSDKIEDRPIGVLRAMFFMRPIRPGSERGFYLTYADGKIVGAIDVIAVLDSDALDSWHLSCAVHEIVSE